MIDYSTEKGADVLVGVIRSYWARKGYSPTVWVEQVFVDDDPFTDSTGRHYYGIKSDMVNGCPKGYGGCPENQT
ncbi:MAG: hypothetical protein ACE5FS_03365 [Paracoccaceae bacterium]